MAFPHELHAAFAEYGPQWHAAIDAGIDISLLVENLSLTPTQRLRQLEQLVNETERLQRAAKRPEPDGSVR